MRITFYKIPLWFTAGSSIAINPPCPVKARIMRQSTDPTGNGNNFREDPSGMITGANGMIGEVIPRTDDVIKIGLPLSIKNFDVIVLEPKI